MQKAVLITGCSSGIGLIAAQDLRNRGYRVLAACRKPQDVENMRQLGLEGIELDLDDSASVERAAADDDCRAFGRRERCDDLFYFEAAGVFSRKPAISS